MQGLKLEWERWAPSVIDKAVVSVYFGGGTPALMGPKAIREILDWIPNLIPNAEITLEANPENISKELMADYASIGINRVSIGLQTLDDSLLHILNRLHSSKNALEAVHTTYNVGIENISVDLMYDLPGQTLTSWESTLNQATNLPITHLSLYNLTIEPHTVFFKYRDSLEKLIPAPEESLLMYKMAQEILTSKGLLQYEISAFSKDNLYSRHNVGYWTGRSFLGFGPSAFSYWEGKRFRNIANLSRYVKTLQAGDSPVDFEEELSSLGKVHELLVINLRLLEGVDLTTFEKAHGSLDPLTLETIERLCVEGLLSRHGNKLKLSDKGVLFYDTIASELI